MLGKRALILREMAERAEEVEAGAARLVGRDSNRIVGAAEHVLEDEVEYRSMSPFRNRFGDGKAALRIARIIADTVQPICRPLNNARPKATPETQSTSVAAQT